MTGLLLVLVFVSLPLGPAAVEATTVVAAGAAAWTAWRTRDAPTPWLWPTLVVALALALASLGRGAAAWIEAGRVSWGLALFVAVPALSASPSVLARAERAGLIAAAAIGAWGMAELGELLLAGASLADGGARGPFSHHLTLGYALLPPLARALQRRWWWAALPIAGGALSSAGLGPALCLVVVLVGVFASPGVALGGGLTASLGLIALGPRVLSSSELTQRAVLWSSGLSVALESPVGVGPAGHRGALALAQDALQPGFFFPLNAHDSALQVAVVAGLGAWVGASWLGWAVWQRTDRAGRAAVAAVTVGALTQDTWGDLEVVRSLAAWAALPLLLHRAVHGRNPLQPAVSGPNPSAPPGSPP